MPRPRRALRGALAAGLALLPGVGLVLEAGLAARNRPLEQRVVIRRDTFGIPHVLAETDEAAAFGLGYAQAEDHGEALGRLYLQARGEAAKHFGEAELEHDLAMRQFDNTSESARLLTTLDDGFRRILRAFAAGASRYVAAHRDELPSWVPDVTAVDVVANIRGEWVEAATSPALRRALERKYPAGTAGDTGEALAPITVELDPAGAEAGSNALALAGSRTTTGRPILLGNPHLDWSSRYWEAHLTVPGRLNFYGSCLVGHPWLRAGFNQALGYVQTNNAPDLMDVYAVPLAPGDPTRYLVGGEARPLTPREVVVDVRGTDGAIRTERRAYWESRLGPVVHRTATTAFAVRHVGLERLTHFDGFYRLSRARTLGDFLGVMRKGLLLTSNFTYADTEGHVLYLWNARLPKRRDDGTSYDLDVPGDTKQHAWRGFHPLGDLPRLLDPPGGYVQNANNSPWYTSLRDRLDPARFPSYVERRPLALRPQRALQMLEARDRFSVADAVDLKFDTRMLVADRVKPALLEAARATVAPSADLVRAIELMERWDNRAAADSPGAVVFYQFWDTYGRALAQPFARPWEASRPMETPAGLAEPALAVEHLENAVRWVRETYGRDDVAWGEVFRFRMGALDLPGDGGPGDLGLYRVMRFREMADRRFVAGRPGDARDLVGNGDAWVLLVHFTRPIEAFSVLAYGQTSDPASPHSADQIRLFANHQLRPVWFHEADVEAHLEREYRPK